MTTTTGQDRALLNWKTFTTDEVDKSRLKSIAISSSNRDALQNWKTISKDTDDYLPRKEEPYTLQKKVVSDFPTRFITVRFSTH